nr:MAG: RNA-dependent RNA polymerase [Riboviria sp.]
MPPIPSQSGSVSRPEANTIAACGPVQQPASGVERINHFCRKAPIGESHNNKFTICQDCINPGSMSYLYKIWQSKQQATMSPLKCSMCPGLQFFSQQRIERTVPEDSFTGTIIRHIQESLYTGQLPKKQYLDHAPARPIKPQWLHPSAFMTPYQRQVREQVKQLGSRKHRQANERKDLNVRQPNKINAALTIIDEMMSKYKLTVASVLITDFLRTAHLSRKVAIVIAFVELYSELLPSRNDFYRFCMKNVLNITAAFSFFQRMFHNAEEEEEEEEPMQLSSLLDRHEQFLKEPIEVSDDMFSNIIPESETLARLTPWLEKARPLFGILVLLAGAFGIQKLMPDSIFGVGKDTADKNIIGMANVIKAWKTVWQSGQETLDDVFKTLFEFAGATYYTKKEADLKQLGEEIAALEKECSEYQNAIRIEFFSEIFGPNFQRISDEYERLNAKYIQTVARFQCKISFSNQLRFIHDTIKGIRDRRTDILCQTAGKQYPVCVWISGPQGVGKTFIAKQLGAECGINPSTYVKSHDQKYWDAYQSQTTCIFDDIGQYSGEEDLMEWHRLAGEAAQATEGAKVDEKDKPYTSGIMIGSSNFPYLTSLTKLKSTGAFARRRDILIWAVNDKINDYRREHHVANPPKEFFDKNPTTYYVLDPMGPLAERPLSFDVGTPYESPACIGTITYERLVDYINDLFMMRREAFRDNCRKALPDKIWIPQEPYPVKETASFIRHYITEKPGAFATPEVPLAAEPANQDLTDAESVTSDDRRAEINLTPVTLISTKHRLPVLLRSAPGTGKTRMVMERLEGVNIVDMTDQADVTKYRNYTAIENLSTSVIFYDDPTTSAERLEHVATVAKAYHEGRIAAAGMIIALNPGQKCYNKTMQQMLERRCHVVNITPDLYSFVNKKLGNWTQEQRNNHLRVQCYHPKDAKQCYFEAYVSLPAALSKYFGASDEVESTIAQHSTFEIPMPEFKFMGVIPSEFADMADIQEMAQAIEVVKQTTAFTVENGECRELALDETLVELYPLVGLLKSAARSNPDDFVRIINEEYNSTKVSSKASSRHSPF